MKLKHLAAVLGFGLTLGIAGQSGAVSLWSFEDDDIDFVLRDDGNGTLDPVTSGGVQVGDVFLSVFEIPIFKVNGADAIPPGMELTGVAAVELTQIIPGLLNGVGTTYVFQPYLDNFIGGLPAGAAIGMWVNGTGGGGDIDLQLNRTVDPATNCGSLADCVQQATLGDLLQVDGAIDGNTFGGGDPDEFWTATQVVEGDAGTDVIDAVLNADNGSLVIGVNFALSNLFHNPAAVGRSESPVLWIDESGNFCGNPGYIADGCVQLRGSATLTGGQGLSNGAVAHSDFDAQKYVPEPATLALFGIGLLGLGGRFRRSAVA